MIGMMNGGAVDVPAEFYGEGRPRGGTRNGKKTGDTRLFSKKQMLREKISYAKDGRMLVNGRLAQSNEVLTPSEMWEGLMMRVMCSAVCESYMKEPPPPPKKRLSDYLPWRRRTRQGTAAANAIANAATAVSELQRTRKDSVSSTKSLKIFLKTSANELKSVHKSSTGSENSKEGELRNVPKAGDNASACSFDATSLRGDKDNNVSKITINADDSKASASNNLYRRSFFSSNSNINYSNNNLSVIKPNTKSSTDEVINSLAAKISAKITRTPSRNSTVMTEQVTPMASRMTRSSSSASLKSPNALAKPQTQANVQMRVSPSRTRRPLSISALTSLTTRYSPRAAPRQPIATSQMAAERPAANAPVGARRPLHVLSFNKDVSTPSPSTSISSRFFNIGGSKISSTPANISGGPKQHNPVYNKVY